MYLFMPLLTHLWKVVLLLVLKMFLGFFLTQKADIISMHINVFLVVVVGVFSFFGICFLC